MSAGDLVFMMGKFPANIPGDRLYSDNHLWLLPVGGNLYRVGFTSYSVRLLQDVYFLSWSVDAPSTLRNKQEIGEIESSKAVSSLYAPAAGELCEFNEVLLNDPSAINVDGYGAGWLYSVRTDETFLSPAEYFQKLESGWEHTQRLIKGQMNE